MSFGFIAGSPTSADFHYRARLPAIGLMQLGEKAVYGYTAVQVPGGRLAVADSGGGKPFMPDVLVLKQITSPAGPGHNEVMVRLITEAREAGQRIFLDVDADIWHPPPMAGVRDRAGNRLSIRQRKQWTPGEHHWSWVRVAEEQMAAADGIICATPALLGVLEDRTDATQTQPGGMPVRALPRRHLIRPGIEMVAYRGPRALRRPRDPIRLGWMGTTDYRGPDLSTIVGPLREALGGRADVEFHFLGFVAGQQPVAEILGADFPAPIFEHPWVELDQLPKALEILDAAVAPQVPCPWAEARSITTGLAYAAAGIPALHTPTAEYLRFAALGGCGVADTPENWTKAIGLLLEATDEDRTMAIDAAARHDVRVAAAPYLELAGG